jgi:hypothetical protein
VYSWAEYRHAAAEICVGLRQLGIGKGDIVGLHSETRAEFYLADLGVMANGSIAAALYCSYPVNAKVQTLRACDARAVFVEDPKSLRSLQAADGPPLPVRWILLTAVSRATARGGAPCHGSGSRPVRTNFQRSQFGGSRDPLSDVGRDWGTKDGSSVSCRVDGKRRDGTPCIEPGALGYHGRFPPIGSHRAACRRRASADTLRHAGVVRRELGQTAAGAESRQTHDSSGSAQVLGTRVHQRLHRDQQTLSACPQALLRQSRRRSGADPTPKRGSRSGCERL